jgi:hypothetical protein
VPAQDTEVDISDIYTFNDMTSRRKMPKEEVQRL